jgi:serine/threonine protein kinase
MQGPQNRIGEVLGHFRLVKPLGKGGYAEVYLAENIHLGTQVAIKVLRTRLLQDYEQDQLRTEASVMMSLDHPHIVRVIDFGIDISRRGPDVSTPYLVMEYAPLGTLRHLYPRGTVMPLQKVVSYIKQVAEALQYAHDHVPVVVHHDVKPENMLVRRPDDVALSDFGIAVTGRNTGNLQIQIQELLEKAARQEQVTIPGTAAYLAPERLQGHTQRASDQYSLAIVAYEWLCGHPPFDGNDLELCNKHVNATPQSLSQNSSHIPQDVDRVIMKALRKQPGDRYETVLKFAFALENAARSPVPRPVPVPPMPRPVPQPPQPISQPVLQSLPPVPQPAPSVLQSTPQPALQSTSPTPRSALSSTELPGRPVPPSPALDSQRKIPSSRLQQMLNSGGQSPIMLGTWNPHSSGNTRTAPINPVQGPPTQEEENPFVTAQRVLATDQFFLRVPKNRWFRLLGYALNGLSVLILFLAAPGILSFVVGLIGAGVAIFMQRQCMITVNKLIAILLSVPIALWWGYLGANVAAHLPEATAPFFGLFFAFVISLGLHIWYVMSRLEN